VLSLCRETGQEVRASDGRSIGRVADLTVRLGGAGPHVVERLLVRRRHAPDLLVPWDQVESFEHTGVLLRADGDLDLHAVGETGAALVDDELMLVRDVVDTQVVDVVGHRLARVADVIFTRTAEQRLEVIAVDVGFGSVVRRLGWRRLAERIGDDAIAWPDLHLTSGRGHTVQLATPRSAIHHLGSMGLAELVARLDTASAAEVLSATDRQRAAAALEASNPDVSERLLRAMPPSAAADVVDAMPEEPARRLRSRLARTPALRGRRFLRTRGWRRRRALPPGTS
jgi:sporulation protein YlmC with PRC-barrel domain